MHHRLLSYTVVRQHSVPALTAPIHTNPVGSCKRGHANCECISRLRLHVTDTCGAERVDLPCMRRFAALCAANLATWALAVHGNPLQLVRNPGGDRVSLCCRSFC